MTGDSKKLVNSTTRLNEAANAHDYIILATVLHKNEIVIDQVGNELIVV